MQKVSVFNYAVTNAGKACDIFIDNIIVDAETDAMIRYYYSEDLSSSFLTFRQQVDSAVAQGCNTFNIKVNCSGGNVFEAFAMNDYLNALRAKGYTVNKAGIGLVASAATIIVSGPGSTISPNCIYMIHDASGGVYGTVSEVESYAIMIRKVNDRITNHFVECTGKSYTVISNLMWKETYMIGDEAKTMGFVENCHDLGYTVNNTMNPDNWIFQNKGMMSVYNTLISNSKNMDIKKMVTDALNGLGVNKPKNEEAIAEAVANALKPLTDDMDTRVTNAVTEAMKNVNQQVTDALKPLENLLSKEDIKDFLTAESIKDLATTQSVVDKIKVVTDELQIVKDTIANKVTTPAAGAKEKEAPKDAKIDREGISFQQS